LIGFTSVSRWQEYGETDGKYFPQRLFPFAATVIVISIPIFLPMLSTTPSIIYSELYNTTNRLLDDLAYRLSQYLTGRGYRAVFFPRDGYGDITVLLERPEADFSHVLAARYAGLGTIGYNHTLLTPQYGPRQRFVSVITDAVIPPDPMQEKSLCLGCKLCQKSCPTSCFSDTGSEIALMDKRRCTEYHAQLKSQHCYPCGICIKVCPVGLDRKLYR
jgi:epoxyqueuosine reductase QueG